MALSAISTYQSLNLYGATTTSMNTVACITSATLGNTTHKSICIENVEGINVSYFCVGNNNKKYFPNKPCIITLPPNTHQQLTLIPFNDNGFAGEPYTNLGTLSTHSTLNEYIQVEKLSSNSLLIKCRGIYHSLYIESDDKSISGIFYGQEHVFKDLKKNTNVFYVTPVNNFGERNISQTRIVSASFHSDLLLTGGEIQRSACGKYKIHKFTSNKPSLMSLHISGTGVKTINYLVVGAGGRANYGGGGAGEYKFGRMDVTEGIYPIHISTSKCGPNSFTSLHTVKCLGGGIGGNACIGGDGACGGGGSTNPISDMIEGGIGNYGHGGGIGYRDSYGEYSGGGGGALEDGGDGDCISSTPGNGGLGFDLITVPLLPGYTEPTTFCSGGGGMALLHDGTVIYGKGGSDYGGGGTGLDSLGTPGIVIVSYEDDSAFSISPNRDTKEYTRKSSPYRLLQARPVAELDPTPVKTSKSKTQQEMSTRSRSMSTPHNKVMFVESAPKYQKHRAHSVSPTACKRTQTPPPSTSHRWTSGRSGASGHTTLQYNLEETDSSLSTEEKDITSTTETGNEEINNDSSYHHVHLYLHH